MIQLHFQVSPKCHHEKFDPQCIWCADLDRMIHHWVHDITQGIHSTEGVMISQQELKEHSTEYPCIVSYPADYEESGRWEAHEVVIRYDPQTEQKVYLNKFDLKERLLRQDLRAKYGISSGELEELASAHSDATHHDDLED